jgi:hypothetical protein
MYFFNKLYFCVFDFLFSGQRGGSGIFPLSPVRTPSTFLKEKKNLWEKKVWEYGYLGNLGTLEYGTTGLAYFFFCLLSDWWCLSVFFIFQQRIFYSVYYYM